LLFRSPKAQPRALEGFSMLVGTILQHKGSAVIGVSPFDTILSVSRTLSENRIGAALVRDPDGAVMGIISERDIVRGMAAHGPGTTGLQAQQFMTREVISISPQHRVTEAMEVMTNKRVRHLPVMEDGKVIGMVSIGDLVKARIDEAELEAAQLKEYVAVA
jgi:CBS domain-containing protein